MPDLTFDAGTLLLDWPEGIFPTPLIPFFKKDDRVGKWRASACDYGPVIRTIYAEKIKIRDCARKYNVLDLKLQNGFPPMPHQARALEAWKTATPPGRGVAVMPTGSGKSYLAVLAILTIKRSVIVIVPTIDLVQQWASSLERFLGIKVGMLGGGSRDIRDITVSTYDSAVLMMENIGDRFGLVVFDECHHLPGPVNRLAAVMCLAPYRLGLSATPDREDGQDALLNQLIGPIVCDIPIAELKGKVLAPYETHRLAVDLSDEEAREYHENRAIYTDFIRRNGINFSNRDGWTRFIVLCARAPDGRRVMNAYLRQRAIARCGKAKLNALWRILRRHVGERTIIFTADNAAAYAIGNHFCLPVITHKTKAAERKDFLDRFRTGEYKILVTSKVLNEGVDVPEASVGVVISGSGSSREHIQRLGRILRPVKGKHAELYELVSDGTGEMYVSERRRANQAYSGTEK